MLIVVVVLACLIQGVSGQFFTGNNIVDIVRSLIIPGMFCIAEMIVLISGGIDVSFPAIASLSMYIVSAYMKDFTGSVIMFFIVGAVLGLAMGVLNGFLIAKFKFQPLIITLGTASLFNGILLGVFAANETPVPQPMYELGKAKLFTATNDALGISSDMPVTILFLIVLIVVVWLLMNKTILGRGIYGVGGDAVSAKRAGFNVFNIRMFVYCFSGAIAGFVGVARAVMMTNCQPTNLAGMEMTCIAACVLGGVSVTGGKGTITGTVIGILLMTMMSNSLILLGIPTYWQRVFTGAIILVGTGISAYQILKNNQKPNIKIAG